jgi:cytochrome c
MMFFLRKRSPCLGNRKTIGVVSSIISSLLCQMQSELELQDFCNITIFINTIGPICRMIYPKNFNVLMVVTLLMIATVFVTQSALGKEDSIVLENTSLSASYNKTELISFVESAVTYSQENGKDKALKEFSNKTGSFVRGDLYIYAYDFNGTCLAHPFKSDWIGKNKLDVTDSNGVQSLKNTLNVAREGKGFAYFIFPNPAHGNRDEFKIAYAMKVDDNWFLGSGIYISCL